MSTFTYVVYLADEEGNLIVDGSGDYIAAYSQEVTIDPAYRAIGGQLSRYCKKVYAFSILNRNNEWILRINRNKFIGKYPTQAAAISVLYGIMTHNDGLDSSFKAWLQDGLNKQISTIDELPPAVENVSGSLEVLADLKTSNAKLMFLGDSISNNGNTNFTSFWHASLFAFKPDAWKGAWHNVQSSNVGLFVSVNNGAITEAETAARPGDNTAWSSDTSLRGNYSAISRGGTTTASTAQAYQFQNPASMYNNTSARTTVLERFPDGIEVFTEADGNRRVLDGITTIESSIMLFGVGNSGYVNSFDTRLYQASGGNIAWWTTTSIAGDINPSGPWAVAVGRSAVGQAAGDSLSGATSGNYSLHLRASNSAVGKVYAQAGFFGRADDGLTVSYAGYGGWQYDSHAYDYDSVIPYTADGTLSSWGYKDAAIQARMNVENTTHLFIQMGSNDLDATQETADEVMAKVQALVTRFRTLRPGVKFIFTTVYGKGSEIANPSWVTNRELFNAKLMEFCNDNSTDCVCIDIDNYIQSQFVDQQDFQDTWLDFANADTTHPNAEGALAIMEYVWDRVIEAEATL